MSRICDCGVNLSSSTHIDMVNKTITEYEGGLCICEWEGWITYDESGSLPKPKENGIYLVRYGDNGGDKYEDEMEFFIHPIRIDHAMYGNNHKPIHWKKESWDDIYVYAWKPK